jgi:hypothetical protein
MFIVAQPNMCSSIVDPVTAVLHSDRGHTINNFGAVAVLAPAAGVADPPARHQQACWPRRWRPLATGLRRSREGACLPPPPLPGLRAAASAPSWNPSAGTM